MKADFQLKEEISREIRKIKMELNETVHFSLIDRRVVKLKAEKAYILHKAAQMLLQNVKQIRAIVIENKFSDVKDCYSDDRIVQEVLSVLKWNSRLNAERIKVIVDSGIVTLSGEVENWFQKNSAYNDVVDILGVVSVLNQIIIKPRPNSYEIATRIKNTFHQLASKKANEVEVEVDGDVAILKGYVDNPLEKKDAEYSARSAPGVSAVINKLQVKSSVPVY